MLELLRREAPASSMAKPKKNPQTPGQQPPKGDRTARFLAYVFMIMLGSMALSVPLALLLRQRWDLFIPALFVIALVAVAWYVRKHYFA
jgi:hypothetical protein